MENTFLRTFNSRSITMQFLVWGDSAIWQAAVVMGKSPYPISDVLIFSFYSLCKKLDLAFLINYWKFVMEQLIFPKTINLLRFAGSFRFGVRCVATQPDNSSATSNLPRTSSVIDGKSFTASSGTSATSSSNATAHESPIPYTSPNVTNAGILLPKDRGEKVDLSHDDHRPKLDDEKKGKPGAAKEKRALGGTMKAWQINQFCDVEGLQLNKECRVPSLTDPFGEFLVLFTPPVEW